MTYTAFVIYCASDTAEAGQRQALTAALLSQPETAEPEDAGLCLDRYRYRYRQTDTYYIYLGAAQS